MNVGGTIVCEATNTASAAYVGGNVSDQRRVTIVSGQLMKVQGKIGGTYSFDSLIDFLCVAGYTRLTVIHGGMSIPDPTPIDWVPIWGAGPVAGYVPAAKVIIRN